MLSLQGEMEEPPVRHVVARGPLFYSIGLVEFLGPAVYLECPQQSHTGASRWPATSWCVLTSSSNALSSIPGIVCRSVERINMDRACCSLVFFFQVDGAKSKVDGVNVAPVLLAYRSAYSMPENGEYPIGRP